MRRRFRLCATFLLLLAASGCSGCGPADPPPGPPHPAPGVIDVRAEELDKQIRELQGRIRKQLIEMMKEIEDGRIDVEKEADEVGRTIEDVKGMRRRIQETGRSGGPAT